MTKSKGFTLIELLITITIIAVLSAIALVSYSAFMKNSRDAKRQSDLKFIQSALEQYHADNFKYPGELNELTLGKIYINQIPTDPNGDKYSYTKPGCKAYCLGAKMENPPPKSDDGCSINNDYNYCVTRP